MVESNGKKILPPGEGRKPTWDEKDRIIMAAERGDIDTLVSISQQGIDVMAAHGLNELTLLHIATSYGHNKLIQVLLHSGAPVDVVDSNNWTALHVAAWRGKSECIQVLCDGGATVDAKCKEGRTPLHIAANNNYSKAVETLFNCGATIDIPDKYGHTALTEAVRQNHGATVMVLINKCKANRSDVAAWYQTKLWQVLKKEEEKIEALAKEDPRTRSTEYPQEEHPINVQQPSKEIHLPPGMENNNLPKDDGQRKDHAHDYFAKTLLGGMAWTALTCSAGVIGYVIIDDDIRVFIGGLSAAITGVVCIDILQWGFGVFY